MRSLIEDKWHKMNEISIKRYSYVTDCSYLMEPFMLRITRKGNDVIF